MGAIEDEGVGAEGTEERGQFCPGAELPTDHGVPSILRQRASGNGRIERDENGLEKALRA